MSDKREDWHRQQYEAALRAADALATSPSWDELTPEQRDNIRSINDKHSEFMNDLGQSIATGSEPPSPFDY